MFDKYMVHIRVAIVVVSLILFLVGNSCESPTKVGGKHDRLSSQVIDTTTVWVSPIHYIVVTTGDGMTVVNYTADSMQYEFLKQPTHGNQDTTQQIR